jgi:hypothetical protein
MGECYKEPDGKVVWVAQPTDETIRTVETTHRVVLVGLIVGDWATLPFAYQLRTEQECIFREARCSMLRYNSGVSLSWTLVLTLFAPALCVLKIHNERR